LGSFVKKRNVEKEFPEEPLPESNPSQPKIRELIPKIEEPIKIGKPWKSKMGNLEPPIKFGTFRKEMPHSEEPIMGC